MEAVWSVGTWDQIEEWVRGDRIEADSSIVDDCQVERSSKSVWLVFLKGAGARAQVLVSPVHLLGRGVRCLRPKSTRRNWW